jgi:hypothetical protein
VLPQPKIDSIKVRFSLSELVPIHKIDVVDDPNFITIQKDGKKFLIEINFVIPTQDINQAESIGRRKARLLCNLISYKCKKGIIPNYKGYRLRYSDGSSPSGTVMPFKVWWDIDLELSAKEIRGFEKNPNQSMYQHFSRSFIALLKYDDHVTVIKELYQILKDKNIFPSNLCKYGYLRDALSHSGQLRERTLKNIEKEFGQNYFVFNKMGFDYDSPTNIQNLNREAWKFMEEMWKLFGI